MNKANPWRRRWLAIPPAMAALLIAGTGATSGRSEPPRRHEVQIRGMKFQPAILEVAVGDTVVWINHDIVPHTATAAGKPEWSTDTLIQEQSGQYVPGRTGEAPYFCTLHPVMKGKLIIR